MIRLLIPKNKQAMIRVRLLFVWVVLTLVGVVEVEVAKLGCHRSRQYSGLPEPARHGPKELFSNGLVSFGAVIVMLAWAFVLAKINKQPVAPALDTTALILPLILGIYRIGCIFNGCCFGVETDNAIGLYLPNLYGEWAVRYPTQLMFMTFDFGLFALLWQWRLRKPADGTITIAFLLSFTSFRFLVDGLRELPKALGNFNLHQLTSLSILLITLYFMFEFRLEKSESQN